MTAYNNDDKEALIFEDDVYATYHDKWEHSIQQIIEMKPKNTECIQLTCGHNIEIINMALMKEYFVPWKSSYFGAGCYYINRKGMLKILNKFYCNKTWVLPVENCVADIDIIYKSMITSTYTKPTFTFSYLISTIHPLHTPAHNISSKTIEYYFENDRKMPKQYYIKNVKKKRNKLKRTLK